MVNLSSIREFYHLHRREVHRYGFVALFFFGALATGRIAVSLLVLLGGGVMYAYDRWGEPWRQKGEKLIKTKPKS